MDVMPRRIALPPARRDKALHVCGSRVRLGERVQRSRAN